MESSRIFGSHQSIAQDVNKRKAERFVVIDHNKKITLNVLASVIREPECMILSPDILTSPTIRLFPKRCHQIWKFLRAPREYSNSAKLEKSFKSIYLLWNSKQYPTLKKTKHPDVLFSNQQQIKDMDNWSI